MKPFKKGDMVAVNRPAKEASKTTSRWGRCKYEYNEVVDLSLCQTYAKLQHWTGRISDYIPMRWLKRANKPQEKVKRKLKGEANVKP